jgi:glycosyltransferase involved in cell wall biosynthesis
MEADAVSVGHPSRGPDEAAPADPPVAHLVVVHKGPTWDLPDIEPFCRLLSRRFTGEVWAYGSYDADTVVGRMRLRVVSEPPLRDLANRVRFFWRALRWVESLRAAREPRLAVIALEPFLSGLIGFYTAWRARGALICEINGVYASRHNAPRARAFVRYLRQRARRLVGGFVLRRALAVRLLFADQLMGFASLPERVITRQFFEITNLAAFHPGREEPIILGVGFPFHVKGFDILCQSFGSLSSRYPDWRLVLIGYRNPEEVREGGYEHPRIEALPGVKQPEVAEWMARCAIFALPSRTEAMGRVLVEAAASGKCRVATRVDGIPTVVEDGVDGLLVEPESVEQLTASLERLMSDPGLRQRLGDAARLRAGREFSEQAYLERYAELVSAALARRET